MADRIFPYGEAPDNAEYVVLEPNQDLPNAKELVAGTGISITVGADTVTISGDGSSAQTYITANDETSTLPNSFQIIEGSNVTLDYVGNQLIISASVSGSGGGTVTIVNSGNANPLFSTNVTTATTTPTIAYTLLAAASATFFRGPASGTSGTPVYGGILGTDLTGALTAGTGITITPATAPGSRLTINAVGFQPISSTLNALSSSLSGTGYITQIGPDSFAERTFQDSTNITWTNPAGIAGDSSANVTSNVYTKSDYSLLNQLASTTPSLGQVPMGASDGSYRLTKPNAGTGIQMDFSNGVFTVSATGATGNPGTLTNFTSSPPPAIFGTSVANPTTAPVLSFNITSNTLQDLATSSGTGIVVSTDGVHHAFRQVQGTSGEIDVTNPAGTAGDITLSLDSSVYTNRDSSVLNALATGLTGTGFVSQNGAQFYDRTLTGTSNRLTITNPTGAAGDPVFDVGTDVLVVGDVTALPGIQIVNGSGTIQIGASGAQGGTLTNLTVGDISPLWDTNVTNPTTAPAVTYTLNAIASGQVLIGPENGADAQPTLRRLLGDDLADALSAGSNITFTPVGDHIEISSTAGGTGTVTDVSVSDLPPLFTTVVNTSTTTPDVQYTLSDAASGTFFSGPASGGPAPGSYRTLTGLDLIPALQAGANITLTMVGDHLQISLAGPIDATLIADGSVTNTEFQYLGGVTSAIQTQLDGKLVSAGDLAPIFTTAESLGNIAFTLSNTASANFLRGPASGSAGPWVAGGILGTDLTGALQAGSNITITQAADPGSRLIIASTGGAGGYATIQEEGSNLTQRSTMNFVGGGITAADDSGNSRTNVTLDSTLNSLAAYDTDGILTQTAPDTFTGRTITGTTNVITVTNGNGVSGNPTLTVGSLVVRTDQANTYSSGLQDFSAVSTTLGVVTLSGTITPSAAETYDIGTANVGLRDIYLGGTSNFTTKITKTTPSADRIFTLPNANSNPIIPDTGASNNFLTGIGPDGVITKAQPSFSNISGTATVGQGGTGVTTTPSNGMTLIGNGTNYTVAAPFAGPGAQVVLGSGTLQFMATGANQGYENKTASFTAVAGWAYGVDSSGGAVTVTLPTAVGCAGQEIFVSLQTAGNALTFNTTSSQTIDGIASGSLTTTIRYNSFTFKSNGANWMLK